MNNYTKLFIDNTEIDLFKAEDLPLNVTKRVNKVRHKLKELKLFHKVMKLLI